MAQTAQTGSRATLCTIEHHWRRPVAWYVLARREAEGPQLLRFPPRSGGEALPVFSSREAAQDFLFSNLSREWNTMEISADELALLLLGSHASTDRVLRDPLPSCLTGEEAPTNPVSRERFVDYLSG